MTRWRNLMVLYNRFPGDDAGLERAISIARRDGSELTIVETIPENGRAGTDLIDAEQLHLNRFVAGLRHEGVSARALVLHDEPIVQVVREVNRSQTELLLISGKNHKRCWPFRSYDPARTLLQECPCPVWAVPNAPSSPLRRVVAGISLGKMGHENALDLKILRLAAALARQEGCDLDVLHAWQFSDSERETSRSGVSQELISALEKRNMIDRKSKLSRLVRQVAGGDIRVAYHVPRVPVGEALNRFVGRAAGGLAVVGMRRKNSLTSRWRASRTESFLSGGTYEVLTVKPDEFVSTVEDDMPYQDTEYRPPSAA